MFTKCSRRNLDVSPKKGPTGNKCLHDRENLEVRRCPFASAAAVSRHKVRPLAVRGRGRLRPYGAVDRLGNCEHPRLEGRDTRGRFAPGNSRRPKGALSRLVTELEQAMELAAAEIVRILIVRAQCVDGSMEAARYILERIAPSRRGRLVEIENFPDICTPADVPSALASLASAVGNGIITVEEGTAIGHLLQLFWRRMKAPIDSPEVHCLATVMHPNSVLCRIYGLLHSHQFAHSRSFCQGSRTLWSKNCS
jgi:hypothetical protein